jgi:hypothetical protein
MADQQQDTFFSPTTHPPSADEILNDLITALEVVMLTRPKPAATLLLEAVQLRIHRIQRHAARRTREASR